MTGSLIYQEVIRPHFGMVTPARDTSRTMDLWLGVYSNQSTQVGFIHTTSTPLIRESEPGARLAITAHVRLPVLGRTTAANLNGKAWLSSERGLSDFELHLRLDEQEFCADGVIQDGTLKVTLDMPGQQMPLEFPVGENPLLSDGLGLTAANMPLLQPGQTAYLDVFDPVSLSTSKVKLTCTGVEALTVCGELVETHRIEMTSGGTVTTVWATSDEEVVRVDTPFGFQLRKITPKEALSFPARREDSTPDSAA